MGKIIRNGIEYPTGGGGGGSSWIESVPEMHKNIFRGQSLGSSVTAAQLEEIQNGTFSNLYVGDYWMIPVTIDGVTKSINWRIADMDYYLDTGDTVQTLCKAHHLVIIPDEILYKAQGVESLNYGTSTFRSTRLSTARTAINTAFPNMVITHRAIFETPRNTQLAWSDSTVEIMRQIQVMGHYESHYADMQIYNTDFKQFALFAIAPKYILSDDVYWLRDTTVNGGNMRALISCDQGIVGESDGASASVQNGVRPYFIIGVDNTEE